MVNVRTKIDKKKLTPGTRVTLNMTTLTIMKILPREVDPQVYQMQNEDPGKISFSEIGGLNDQIRVLRETVELPITNPELFKRVGIKPPKVNSFYLGRFAVWPSWNGENADRKGSGLEREREIPKSSGLWNRGQVHRRVSPRDPRDVCVREGKPTLHYFHGRNRRDRRS